MMENGSQGKFKIGTQSKPCMVWLFADSLYKTKPCYSGCIFKVDTEFPWSIWIWAVQILQKIQTIFLLSIKENHVSQNK